MSFNNLEKQMREDLGLASDNTVLREIVDISREIPENVNSLNPSVARYLSGRFLKGMDLSGELLSVAVAHELRTKVLEKKEHGNALIVRSRGKGLKNAKEKEAYANTDDLYIEAAEKHIQAKAFRIRVENIRKDFEKAHYLMKKIAEDDSDLEADRHGSSYDDEGDDSSFNGWLNESSKTTKAKEVGEAQPQFRRRKWRQ